MNITYIEGKEELLLHVKPLWEKTREYHSSVSTYFSSELASKDFDLREKEIKNKSADGQLKIICAKDLDTGDYVGYCVAVIDKENIREIESIYVNEAYRRKGIASRLMSTALAWMNNNQVKTKRLSVAVGNESVMNFYKKFGFYPYQILMEVKEKK